MTLHPSLHASAKGQHGKLEMFFTDFTVVFSLLADAPPSIIDSTYEVLEKYVVLLYDKTCQLTQVNEASQHLFVLRSRAFENIPPTQAALKYRLPSMFGDNQYKKKPYYQVLQTGAGTKVMVHGTKMDHNWSGARHVL